MRTCWWHRLRPDSQNTGGYSVGEPGTGKRVPEFPEEGQLVSGFCIRKRVSIMPPKTVHVDSIVFPSVIPKRGTDWRSSDERRTCTKLPKYGRVYKSSTPMDWTRLMSSDRRTHLNGAMIYGCFSCYSHRCIGYHSVLSPRPMSSSTWPVR